MATTPEATKGVPRIEANPGPSLRADHNALADWAKNNVHASFTSTSNRDADPLKWVGKIVETSDTHSLWLCTDPAGSGNWAPIGGVPVPIALGSVPGTLDWSPMRIRKIGNRLFMDGRVASTVAITASLNGGVLPAGARPAVDQVFPAVSMTSGFAPAFSAVNISTAGVIQLNLITSPTSTVYVAFDVTFELA